MVLPGKKGGNRGLGKGKTKGIIWFFLRKGTGGGVKSWGPKKITVKK